MSSHYPNSQSPSQQHPLPSLLLRAAGVLLLALSAVPAAARPSAPPSMIATVGAPMPAPIFAVHDNVNALLSAAGTMVTDTFACAGGPGSVIFPATPFTSLDLGDVVVTHTGLGSAGTVTAHPALTDGHGMLWGAADLPPTSLTLTFTFASPTSAFGVSVLTFGNGGGGRPGSMSVSTDTGLSQVIDSVGSSAEAGRDLFIGVTSDMPFTQVSLTTSHENDLVVTDEILVQPAIALTCFPLDFAFDFFVAEVKLGDDDDDDDGDQEEIRLEGIFMLSADTDGIDLISEDVFLELDAFALEIPAGSFERRSSKFRFRGSLDGVKVKAEIKDLGGNTFEIKVKAKRADLTGVLTPVEVVLAIGNDIGMTLAEIHDD